MKYAKDGKTIEASEKAFKIIYEPLGYTPVEIEGEDSNLNLDDINTGDGNGSKDGTDNAQLDTPDVPDGGEDKPDNNQEEAKKIFKAMTIGDLKKLCDKNGITYTTKWDKDEFVAALVKVGV